MSQLPDLTTVLEEHSKGVNSVHIFGTIMLIVLFLISWYHSSSYYHRIISTDKDQIYNIEQNLRIALLINMLLMCFAFPGITLCQATDIGRYYRDNDLKEWNEVDYNDYPEWNLYLLVFTLNIFAVHHTINVIRIFYELTRSMYFGQKYGAIILCTHLLIYFVLGMASSMNPFVLIYSIIIIDYPQHIVIIGIYSRRLCNRSSEYRTRNIWGLIAEVAHCVCLIPHVYVTVALDDPSTELKIVSFIILYVIGWINIIGWYKIIVNTPKEFVTNKMNEDVELASELQDTTNV